MENEEMFDQVLQTLDLVLWVTNQNMVMISFYEKEIVSPMMLHKRTAIPEGVRGSALNQEIVRRTVKTSKMVKIEDRVNVVDYYCQKLINSEFNRTETRRVTIGGLKGYERLLSLSKDVSIPMRKPHHMAGHWNSRNMRIAKLKSRDNWFKEKEN